MNSQPKPDKQSLTTCQKGTVPVGVKEPAHEDAAVGASTHIHYCHAAAITHSGLTVHGLQQIRETLQAESQIREPTASVALPKKKKIPTHTQTLPHSCQCSSSSFPQRPQRTPKTRREKLELAGMDVCNFAWLTPCVAQFAACSY